MKKIIFILFAYFCLPSFGGIEGGCQPNKDKNRDKIWLFGKYSRSHNIDIRYGNTILNFNTNPPTYYYQYMVTDFKGSSASLADTNGNLLCYTNGLHIGNTNGEKMRYGDSLDLNGLFINQSISYSGIQGGVCLLPVPNKTNSAVVLYAHRIYTGEITSMGLNAAFIDFNRENGLGMVIKKDSLILNETCQGYLVTACRHANGRDWWIIKPGIRLANYYSLLLSPRGIQTMPIQTMPVLSNDDTGRSMHACFSPDGKKYAHFDLKLGTWLYDFDRCTGLLSNRQLLERRSTYDGDIFCGVAFSPNSRYMYVTQDTAVYQYDMQAANIENSKQTVAVYDGFIYDVNFRSIFAFPQLAPDGKIYINGTGGKRHLHIIQNPNEGGLACNVEQHAIMLPTYYAWTMPNFPYFRLGSEPGTVCDSLGIETGVTDTLAASPSPSRGGETVQMSVSPNPTSDICTVSLMSPLLGRGRGRLFSADGRLLETFSNPFLNQSTFTINLKNYAKGVYIVEYAADGGGSARARVVRQ
jgi:hypothetical protein